MKNKTFILIIIFILISSCTLFLIGCNQEFDFEGSKDKMLSLDYQIIEMSPQIDNVAGYFVADKEHANTIHVIQFISAKTAKIYYDDNSGNSNYPNMELSGNVVYFGTLEAVSDLLS